MLYRSLLQYQFPLYPIILNQNQEYITNIENKNYLLLNLYPHDTVTLNTIELFQIPISQEEILPWHELWMNKVDYYEKHVHTIANEKIKKSFFYYIGMAENAISFYQMIKHKNALYISHYRMNSDFDYWNIANITVDYRVRDVAEYTKNAFFSGNFSIAQLYDYFYRNQYTQEDYLLFYARMLFPSYYFDCYDAIAEGEDDSCLDIYIDKIKDYEVLLKELYLSFSQSFFLPKIDWIVEQ